MLRYDEFWWYMLDDEEDFKKNWHLVDFTTDGVSFAADVYRLYFAGVFMDGMVLAIPLFFQVAV